MRNTSTLSKSLIAASAHTDVHRALRRYFELAQDFIVASLAVVLLVVMVQGLWVLARLAFVLGRNPSEVLSQIVLLLVLVELFRTLILYLHEHRVAVPLMLEVALVSELREILLNQPTVLNGQLYANALLIAVLGSLLLSDRLIGRREQVPDEFREDDASDSKNSSGPVDRVPNEARAALHSLNEPAAADR